MTRWLNVFGAVVAIGIMISLIASQWQQIQTADLAIDKPLFVYATIAAIFVFYLDAAGWHLILRSQNAEIKLLDSIRIWMISAVTRYLPGGVWAYASRASLASQKGIPVASSAMSLYTETLLLASTSLAVGFPSLIYFAPGNLQILLGLVVIICGALALHPKMMALWQKLPGRVGAAIAKVALPDVSQSIKLYTYYVVFWLAFSVTFLLFASAIVDIPVEHYLGVGTSMPLGFMIGFVVFFVPGGIGIREGVIYALLLPHMSSAEAIIIAVGSRIWLTLVELIALLLIVALSSPALRFRFVR